MLPVVLSTLLASVPIQAGVFRPAPAATGAAQGVAGRHSPPGRAEPWSFPPPADSDR